MLLNLIFYGPVGAGLIYAAFDPAAQGMAREQASSGWGLPFAVGAVIEFPQSFRIIFALNLIAGTLPCTTLPSLMAPLARSC